MSSVQQNETSSSTNHINESQNNAKMLATVFGLTLSADNVNQTLVYVESESIEHAVFERLMMEDPESKLVRPSSKKNLNVDSHFVQKDVICYLFESYRRILQWDNASEVDSVKKIVLRNVVTTLQEPKLFEDQEVNKIRKFINIKKSIFIKKKSLFENVVELLKL